MSFYNWRVGSGRFDIAANWMDESTGENPATTVPGISDRTVFDTGSGGTISGTGSVTSLYFDPGSAWTISGLLAGIFINVDGAVTIANGGALTMNGGYVQVASGGGTTGQLTIGPGGTFNTTLAPQSTTYSLEIGGGTIALEATGIVTVEGAGALLDLNGNPATVGLTRPATGTLNVLAGAVVRFGTPDGMNGVASLSVAKTGSGTVNVSGKGSALVLTNGMYAGLAGTGTVNVSDGGTLTEIAQQGANVNNFGGSVRSFDLPGGTGLLNITNGGAATFGDAVTFGADGSLGTGLVSAGTLNIGGVLRLGTGTRAAGGTGMLTISNGGAVHDTAVFDPSSPSVLAGDSANTRGTIVVDGAGSLLDAGQSGGSIGNAGSASLTVSNGATALFKSANSQLRPALGSGDNTVASGTVTVTGAGSSIYAAGAVYLGRAGTANLMVGRGASFTGGQGPSGDGTGANASFGVSIGDGTPNLDVNGNPSSPLLFGGSGTAQVTEGSLLYSLGSLRVGYRGTRGSLLVDGGSVAQGAGETLVGGGTDRTGAHGTVVVRGGSALLGGGGHMLATSGISLASDAWTNGEVFVTGAGSLLNANGDRLTVGSAGYGALVVTDGARALSGAGYSDAEAALAVGGQSRGNGTVGIDGGGSQLLASGVAVIGGTDTGAGITPGGTGQVSVTSGALLQTGTMIIFGGSGVRIDGASSASVTGDLADLGTLSSNGRLTVTGTLEGGGAVALGGGLAEFGTMSGMTVSLSGTDTTLRLHGLTGANTISAMQTGDTIDLVGIAIAGVSLAGSTVTASGGSLTLAPAPSGTTYGLLGDANGGTDIVLTPATPPANAVAVSDITAGSSATATGDAYTGAADYLQRQYVFSGTDNVAIRANVPNAFLQGGSGDDALEAVAGNNVLNGGAGSSFLVGGTGIDGGYDTFVLDVRGGGATWSTLVNFHPGDTALILGFHGGTSTLPFTASGGIGAYTGATIHSELNGPGTGVDASLTFAGIDQATAQGFRYTPVTPTTSMGGASGEDYLLIQYF